MKKTAAVVIFLLLSYQSADAGALTPMFQEAAQTWGVPAALTQAIASVESGLSPWALNIEGKGYRFDSKEKAIKKAQEAQAAGRTFDSGVMQVSDLWLKKYGIPLEAAFDPLANIYLGSWILKQEISRHGQSWNAVGAYHSPSPEKGRRYAEIVKTALTQGSVKAGPIVPDSAAEKSVARQADYSPLVVVRRNRQMKSNQTDSDSIFVKRLHTND